MRVGILAPDLSDRHGWGMYSLSLVRQLQQIDNLELTIISAHNSPDHADIDQHRLLPIVNPAPRLLSLRLLRTSLPVRGRVADCDIIHTTIEPYAPLATLIAGTRPTVVTVHGSYVHLPRIRRYPVGAWYRRAFQRSTLMTVSHYTARVARTIIPDAQTQVIPNGVDHARFAELPPLPHPPTRPTILTAGGVKQRKGTLPLIHALAQVRAQMPDVQLVVIGTLSAEPAYVVQVQQAIAAHDLHDHVQLLGFVDDATLLGWYGAADVFAMPSVNAGWKFEGFGLVHLEANAAGLPVIGADDCGAEDAIEHGVTGLLISQANMQAELPAALLSLLRDPARARQMGQVGRVRARAYTWARVARQVHAAYRTALA